VVDNAQARALLESNGLTPDAARALERDADRYRCTRYRKAPEEDAMNKPVPVNPPELRSTLVCGINMPGSRTTSPDRDEDPVQDDEALDIYIPRWLPPVMRCTSTPARTDLHARRLLEDPEGTGPRDFVWRPAQHPRRACAKWCYVHLGVNRPNRFRCTKFARRLSRRRNTLDLTLPHRGEVAPRR